MKRAIAIIILILSVTCVCHAQQILQGGNRRRTVQSQHYILLIQQEKEPPTPVKKLGVVWMDLNGDAIFKDYDGNKTNFGGQDITYNNITTMAIDGNLIYVDATNRSLGFFQSSPSSDAYIQLSDKLVICKTYTSAGVQACVDALGSDGGKVELPEGIYMWSSEVTSNKDNITIQGSGWGTILWIDANTTWQIEAGSKVGDVIDLTGDGCIIRDLKINGRKGSVAVWTSFKAASVGKYGKLENIWFYDCKGSNYGIARTGNYGQIKGCMFESCGNGIYLLCPYNKDHVIITKNIFYDNSPYTADLALDWSDYCIVSNNIFYDEDGKGHSHACIYLADAFGCVVSDNLMYDICRGIVNSSGHGSYSKYNNITGNCIYQAEEYGIAIPGGNYINIVDNEIYDTDEDQTDLIIGYGTAVAKYNNISDNLIMSYLSVDQSSSYGIQLGPNADYNKISGNVVGGQKIYGIYLQGPTDVLISDNYLFARYPTGSMRHDNAIYIDNNCTDIGLWGNYIFDPNNDAPILDNSTSKKLFEIYSPVLLGVGQITIAVDPNESPVSYELTPDDPYIELNCSDPNGCNLSISETGAKQGKVAEIVNIGSNDIILQDSSGVCESSNPTLGEWDTVKLIYASDRWVQHGPVGNN